MWHVLNVCKWVLLGKISGLKGFLKMCECLMAKLISSLSTKPSPCTVVAAKVLNRCTLSGSDPKHLNTVVFDYQFLEDFRSEKTTSQRRLVGISVEGSYLKT